MTCPHCGYVHRLAWDADYVKGEDKGDFYNLPVNARRESSSHSYLDEEVVYFCPKCGKGFIEVRG